MKYLTATMGAALALAVIGFSVPATAGDYYRQGGSVPCYKCPPPKNYDSQEVVKQTKDIDHSAVIETQTVVPSKRLIETNHLVIHENETRNVGTVVHKNTIIEKETVFTKRNVDHKTINTEVNLVENKYQNERKHIVEERELPGVERNLPNCDCDYKRPHAVQAYGMAPRYVSSR